ncbi:hypothetical protein BDV38DRAFT_283796 [Aspergillus pseudotamarii]|uniref:Uncharacterized protein n=1 Tax=Aspergillus pseudotamarii TaxID=132259 RepID=A0A5N6STX1_ASPPS|nr:uncharacterized protein BDV38DRAFT_283796 [Aspergillus pseudotamarii]KAE8136584.1 hypothetical protein BDV38DRAFT_283796 [Aspergillus pseudotamarii]
MLPSSGSFLAILVALWLTFALIGFSDGYERSTRHHGRLRNPPRPVKAVSLCGLDCPSCVAGSNAAPKVSTPKNGVKGGSLHKRVIAKPEDEDFDGDVDSFLVSQYMRAVWVPLSQQSLSSALFRELGNVKFNMAVQDLYGCTSVVVVSEKGIWMSHLWENPAFATNGPSGEWLPSADNKFEADVLNALEDGNQEMPGLAQFTKNGGAFIAAYKPFAYIFYPTGSQYPNYNRAYKARINQISQKLQRLLPLNTPPLLYQYDRAGGDMMRAKGKVLFQYEPNERIMQTKDGPLQQALNRIWLEDRPTFVHQRYWPAWPRQMASGNANQRRDAWRIPTPGTPGSIPNSMLSGSETTVPRQIIPTRDTLSIITHDDGNETSTATRSETPIALPTSQSQQHLVHF